MRTPSYRLGRNLLPKLISPISSGVLQHRSKKAIRLLVTGKRSDIFDHGFIRLAE